MAKMMAEGQGTGERQQREDKWQKLQGATKGKWSKREVLVLRSAIDAYATESGVQASVLVSLGGAWKKHHDGKALRKKGAWIEICAIAQAAGLKRPASAMYRYASRNWGDISRAPWSEAEERNLVSLVHERGRRRVSAISRGISAFCGAGRRPSAP